MKLSLKDYEAFEEHPFNYGHLRAFAQVTDCDFAALVISPQTGSADLAVLCADNKAASIALSLVEDWVADRGYDFPAISVSTLLLAMENARSCLADVGVATPTIDTPSPALTKRQLECLAWARSGKSSMDIGAILGLSSRTIDGHVQDACSRLGVRTRVQAISAAISLGFLAP